MLAALASRGLLHPLAPHLADAWTEVAFAVLVRAGLRADESRRKIQPHGLPCVEELLPEQTLEPSAFDAPGYLELRRSSTTPWTRSMAAYLLGAAPSTQRGGTFFDPAGICRSGVARNRQPRL